MWKQFCGLRFCDRSPIGKVIWDIDLFLTETVLQDRIDDSEMLKEIFVEIFHDKTIFYFGIINFVIKQLTVEFWLFKIFVRIVDFFEIKYFFDKAIIIPQSFIGVQ